MESYDDTFDNFEEISQAFDEVLNESVKLTKQTKDLKRRLKKANLEKREYKVLVEKVVTKMKDVEETYKKEMS